MKITIQTPDFRISQALEHFAYKQLEKLLTFNDRIIRADLLMKLDQSDTKRNKVCELKLAIPGNDLFATKTNSTFEEAISKSVAAIANQLSKRKAALNTSKRRRPATPFQTESA